MKYVLTHVVYSLIALTVFTGCVGNGYVADQLGKPNDALSITDASWPTWNPDQTELTGHQPATLIPPATELVSKQASPSRAIRPSLFKLGPEIDLDQVIAESNGNVLIDFYADWCGPCQKQSKILDQMKNTANETQTLIVKVNVDEHRQIAQQYRVASLPTLVMIKEGKVFDRKRGLASKEQLSEWMKTTTP